MTLENTPILIAVAGSSGAGKSTLAAELTQSYNQTRPNRCIILSADNYYKDLSHLPKEERDERNFDHPDAIDFALLREHIQAFKRGESIEVPHYDFATHCRAEKTSTVNPSDMIVFEGILLLTPEANLLDLFDVKLFVESNTDVCFERRLKRDMEERSRTKESVEEQFAATVKPMDLQFVRPSRNNADLVVKNGARLGRTADNPLFNLNPVIRYLDPILVGSSPPSKRTIWNLFQKEPTEMTLTGYGCPEVGELDKDHLRNSCIVM